MDRDSKSVLCDLAESMSWADFVVQCKQQGVDIPIGGDVFDQIAAVMRIRRDLRYEISPGVANF